MDKEENTVLSFLTISKAQAGSVAPWDGKDPVVLFFFFFFYHRFRMRSVCLWALSPPRDWQKGERVLLSGHKSLTRALPHRGRRKRCASPQPEERLVNVIDSSLNQSRKACYVNKWFKHEVTYLKKQAFLLCGFCVPRMFSFCLEWNRLIILICLY